MRKTILALLLLAPFPANATDLLCEGRASVQADGGPTGLPGPNDRPRDQASYRLTLFVSGIGTPKAALRAGLVTEIQHVDGGITESRAPLAVLETGVGGARTTREVGQTTLYSKRGWVVAVEEDTAARAAREKAMIDVIVELRHLTEKLPQGLGELITRVDCVAF
jgi:hypothetical protein